MTDLQLCPCGSGQTHSDCCLPVIQGRRPAATAEALMRARYSAFARGAVDFIMDSHHSRTRASVKREELDDWSRGSEWLGLKIVDTHEGQADDQTGTVVFQALYRHKDEPDGEIIEHWERALFEKENGTWRFLDAAPVKTGPIQRTSPKVGRNDPCKCGSGKKFKKCCGN